MLIQLGISLLLTGSVVFAKDPISFSATANTPAKSQASVGSGNPRYPVAGEVIRDFDPPELDWLPGHRGIDLAAVAGLPVRAPAAGVIGFVGDVADTPVVTIHHGNSRSTFQPVVSGLRVGESVDAGDKIGVVAARGGHCAARCLHWGLRVQDHYLDPRLLVETVRVRLVPEEF